MRAARERLGCTQEELAARFGLDLASVRNWEQGRTRPEAAARTLLALIGREPTVVDATLRTAGA